MQAEQVKHLKKQNKALQKEIDGLGKILYGGNRTSVTASKSPTR